MATLYSHLEIAATDDVLINDRTDLGSTVFWIGPENFAIHLKGTPVERREWMHRLAASVIESAADLSAAEVSA